MRLKIIISFLILTFFCLNILAQNGRIDKIEISGLKRTREDYLRRFISVNTGSKIDSSNIAEDERKLRTLSSVMNVNATTKVQDTLTVLTYQVEERWTLLPVGDFGASKDNIWIGAGLMETNLFGRGLYFYGYVQYKTPFAAHIILRNPYISNTRIGYELQYLNNEVIEKPEYSGSDLHKLHEISAALKYELEYEKDFLFGISIRNEKVLFQENLIRRKDEIRFFAEFKYQRLDYRFFRLNGWKNYFRFSLNLPDDSFSNTISVFNDTRLYKSFQKSNIGIRIFGGLTTQDDLYFLPFIVDSYRNFRGSGYRYLRGNQTVSTNVEYRYTIFEFRNFGAEVLAFSDIGWIGYRYNNKYELNKSLYYGGSGFRFHIRKIHNAVLSIDYGLDLSNTSKGGWVIGWGQYF